MMQQDVLDNVAGEAVVPPQGAVRPGRWVAVWFVVLIAVSLVVRLGDPTGWVGSDDASYHSAAEHLLAGKTLERVHHQYARMALIVPVAMSMWVFGDSPAAVIAPTVVASIGCIALVAVAGWLLWGWAEGLCAACVVSFLPYFRTMSSVAYPDMHVCLWTTAGVVLALLAVRGRFGPRTWMLGVGCGLTVGLACSAKVFGVFALVPIVWLTWMSTKWRGRDRLRWVMAVGVGVVAMVFLEGLFYQWSAGDFWFKLHAIRGAQGDYRYFPSAGYFRHATYGALAWSRLTMLFRTGLSGWGTLAVLFFPAALITCLLSKRGRTVAVWAAATYIFIAVVPVTHRHHWHPFTPFDGRHILVTCVPFALCFAWVACRAVSFIGSPVWIRRGLPIALIGLAWLSQVDAGTIRGFRDRDTQRCGLAIKELIASEDWEEGRDICMPASLYIRHRVLFPKELRTRLRVVVDDSAPDWWRTASVDIESRAVPMPNPSDAYLIATPKQLDGELEFWDYGVGMPNHELIAWRKTTPRVRMVRYADKTIAPQRGRTEEGTELLLLLGGSGHDQQVVRAEKGVADAG